MRPVDLQNMVVRSMDVERMQSVLLQAQLVQQQQIAQRSTVEMERRLSEVQELAGRPGQPPLSDAPELADRERAGGRYSPDPFRRRRNRTVAAGPETAPEAARGTPAGVGGRLDVYG